MVEKNKNKEDKKKLRSEVVLSAILRHKSSKFKHRCEERGGSKKKIIEDSVTL